MSKDVQQLMYGLIRVRILTECDRCHLRHLVDLNPVHSYIEFRRERQHLLQSFHGAGSANSDMGLSGGSVRRQPKMAEMRRSDEQTSASEPHSDLQGEGGIGRDQGRKDAIGVGGAV